MANIILLVAAFIWGTAFVAQRVAAPTAGVFLFNGTRFLLGGLTLLPVIWATRRSPHLASPRTAPARRSWLWMLAGGFLLFAAGGFQQAGLKYTTAGNAAFITGMYVVFVPIILFVVWRQRTHLSAWAAALLAAVGILLMSAKGTFQLAPGDGLELVGAVLWAMHVIVVGRAVQHIEPLRFSAGQFLFSGAINLLPGLVFEQHLVGQVVLAWPAVLYTGILSVGVGYTLQAVGQRRASPAAAAIILSTEAVFAALSGWLLLGEQMEPIQLLGCGLILAAIGLTVFPQKSQSTTGAG